MVREVWIWNRSEELRLIEQCLQDHPFIAIDTEFPGSLRETSKDASDDERYENMRFSVDRTKLIQLGFTLFDLGGRIGGTWEINFSDFGEFEDAQNERSIQFLKENGLNLDKIREQGIGLDEFFPELTRILKRAKRNITWVTFHGSYDIAYLIKYLTGGESLPLSSERFSKSVGRILGSVYDLKVMAGRYGGGLSNRLGLESLAHELGVNRVGTAHHAGSDSELTARVFVKMAQIFNNVQECEGYIYGLGGYRVLSNRVLMMMRLPPPLHINHAMMMRRCNVMPLLPPFPLPMFVAGLPPPVASGYVLLRRV